MIRLLSDSVLVWWKTPVLSVKNKEGLPAEQMHRTLGCAMVESRKVGDVNKRIVSTSVEL